MGRTVGYFPQFCVLLECKKLQFGKKELHCKLHPFQNFELEGCPKYKIKKCISLRKGVNRYKIIF